MERRKELLMEYKMTERPKGVFQLRNTVNGKILVGSSPNLDKAYNKHRTQCKFGGHINKALQADWDHYGEESFVYEILEQLKPAKEEPDRNDRKALEEMEEKWLEKLQPYGERGYNKPKQKNK